uniref:Transmembrane protein 45B n=1 Tax=Strigamia maritima TaxID=126957 RepID=T1JB67_STRMM
MGSFGGHAIPGFFLCAIGFWWMINICIRYYSSRKEFKSALSFTSPSMCCKKWPLDILIVLSICTVALAGQIFVLKTRDIPEGLIRGEYYEHAVLFGIFILMSLVELLRFFKLSLPQNFEYLSALGAFSLFALVLVLHARGLTPMHSHLHMILAYTVTALCISLAIEMYNRKSFTAAVSRGYFTFLSGSWIIQIGLFLYPLKKESVWAGDLHSEIVLSTMIFSWHCAGIFAVLALFVVLLGICYGDPASALSQPKSTETLIESENKIMSGANGGIV